MAVPDFQSMMLPLLEAIADGAEHSNSAVYDSVARQMNVSAEDLQLMHSGGEQTVFYNRVAWGKTYLKKGGLLQSPKRGTIQITEAGQRMLKNRPAKIDIRFLKQFGAGDWLKSSPASAVVLVEEAVSESSAATPEDLLEAGSKSLRDELVVEIIEQVKRCSSQFFERLVVKLLVAMGYGGSLEDAGQVLGRSGDGGIDGTIKEDKLGLDVICIQAKRWEGTVGRPVVQAFAGSMEGFRARKGVLITTATFSKEAEDYITRIERKIVLVDGQRMAELMIAHNVGVTVMQTYEIKRLDTDFFTEDE
ncbi:MAG: restriction endonuclease [Candidatus Saccharimonas sp.]|nr:restriction endonuclease [Planctomycetaceae bacterium]